jgi:DNA polymerase III delta prime subunit
MITPSFEQEQIVNSVKNGNSVIVSAVAGSGKTTTVLCLAKAVFPKKILQITYNKLLKFDVRERVASESIKNVKVHTYHSLYYKYYNNNIHNDDELQKVIKKDIEPIYKIDSFDILVIDETQDMTPLLYEAVHKFLKDYSKPVQIVLLGDVLQGIYEFKQADTRFLSIGKELWNSRTMIQYPLTISYRLTNQIAQFVNECMLGRKVIHTNRDGPPVDYIRHPPFRCDTIFNILNNLLKEGKYTPDDIFVLSGSVRSKTGSIMPVNKLENKLVENGIPCFVPSDDDSEINDDIIKGKVAFCSIHQSKGRERKIVVVYGFDIGWFRYYGRDYDQTICPNELYVATTRAKEKLIIFESKESAPLPFLKLDHDEIRKQSYINFDGTSYEKSNGEKTSNRVGIKSAQTSPTDLVKFIDEDNSKLLSHIKDSVFSVYSGKEKDIVIPNVVPNSYKTFEDVSDINGIAIPAMWEEKISGKKSSIWKSLQSIPIKSDIVKEHLLTLDDGCYTPSDFIHLANIWQCHCTSFNFKLAQITKYDWLTQDMVDECFTVLEKYLSTKSTKYEVEIHHKYFVSGFGNVDIQGRMDAVSDTIIWELKCVKELQMEHFLQLIIYAWMWKNTSEMTHGSRKFMLMNVRTGEIYELNTRSHLIEEAISILFENKYNKKEKADNTIFIEKCKQIQDRYTINTIISDTESEVVSDSLSDLPITNDDLTHVNLTIFKNSDLIEICKKRNIKGYSGKKKGDLINLIENDMRT